MRANIFLIKLVVFLIFGIYHSYQVWKHSSQEQEKLDKEGKSCLYEFKVKECNPINLSDDCKGLADFFKKSDNGDKSMDLALLLAHKTSKSLTETLVGPILSS